MADFPIPTPGWGATRGIAALDAPARHREGGGTDYITGCWGDALSLREIASGSPADGWIGLLASAPTGARTHDLFLAGYAAGTLMLADGSEVSSQEIERTRC